MILTTIVKDYKELIAQWMQQIEQTLQATDPQHEELVRRASFIVRNKALQGDYFHQASQRLYINIQDTQPQQVELDFQKETISCTCLQQHWCRHSVASVMQLYQYHASLQQWTTMWRAKKQVQLSMMAHERTPASWQALAKSIMTKALPRDGRTIQPYLISAIDEDVHAKLRQHMPLEREWQPLYKLYMELYVLQAFWQHFGNPEQLQGPIFDYYLTRKLENIPTLLEQHIKRSTLFEMDAFYEAIERLLRSFMLEEQGYSFQRLSLYTMYWELVIRDTPKRKAELQKLQAISIVDTTDAVLFLAVLVQDDTLLKQLHIVPERLHFYVALADCAYRQQLPHMAAQLLYAILPYLQPYIATHMASSLRTSFIQHVAMLFENISLTAAQEQQLYEAFGAHGLQYFSHYLLREERYDQWVALHMLYPTSIAYLETCGLKDVLAASPVSVLPLYHVYALREVEQKTRINYKQAVRIWRMMKSAAKKSHKADYFNHYIETMQQQYKRLRALQEEMTKGKLEL